MFDSCIPDQAKLDLRNDVHQEGDDYRIALFLQAHATDKNRSTVRYSRTGESSGASYAQGGKSLSGFSRRVGAEDTVYIDFDNPSWENVSISADAAVIYNASKSNKVLIILAIGMTAVVGGTFSIMLKQSPHLSLITISPKEVYGPGDRAVTAGGLRESDIRDLLDLAAPLVLTNQELSDEERARQLEEIDMKRAHLHYRFDDCDHRSKACAYSHGRKA